MRRPLLGIVVGSLAVMSVHADEPTPADRLNRLVTEYDAIRQTFDREMRAATSGAAAQAASDKQNAWNKEVIALIRMYPAEPAAFALIEKHLYATTDTESAELADIIRKHHMANPRLGRLVHRFASSRDPKAQAFAVELADTHPDRTIRGQASLVLGEYAKWEIFFDQDPRWREKSQRTLTVEQKARLQAQAETYLARAAEKFADVIPADQFGTVGTRATAGLTGLRNIPNLRPGGTAPEIEGDDLDGARLRLSDFRGKVVLVVFWASWCGPCMHDVPHERELVEKLKGRPFVLVGVNGDENRDSARAAVVRAGITWRSFAATGRLGSIPAAWNVRAWPTTVVIDHTGVVRHLNLRGKDLDGPLEELVTRAEAAKHRER
jgi:thiol-disulfide isomerase/thioredoxin